MMQPLAALLWFWAGSAGCQPVVDPAPGSSEARYARGESLLAQKNYQAAANEFREALIEGWRTSWTGVWSHIRLGEISEATGQPAQAANSYRLALFTNDNTQGALDRAEGALNRVVAQHPEIKESMRDVLSGLPVRRSGPTPPPANEPVERTEVEYSEEARIAGLEGIVEVEGVVDDQGLVQNARVSKPLGLGLDEMAVKAVGQWRFAPGRGQVSVAVEFALPAKQSRWHLVEVKFDTPAGAARPTFLNAYYPPGPGISHGSMEEGQLVVALGRMGMATLAFDIDEDGRAVRLRALQASDKIWADEAASLVRQWLFKAGSFEGRAIAVPCTVKVLWGRKSVPAAELVRVAEGGPPRGPSLITRVEPGYTDEARKLKVEGTVEVEFEIDAGGVPRGFFVVRGLGFGLDEKAVEAVAQWRFRNDSGRPVMTSVSLDFRRED